MNNNKDDFSKMIYGEGGFTISHSYFSNRTVNFQESTFCSEVTSFSGMSTEMILRIFQLQDSLGTTCSFLVRNLTRAI